MRPNNSNKRLRGRNRSKNSNPLARTYESNGPDVKIRGSALQVADKYAQLARDAQSSGDRVMAENYYQHAEHYYRIVAQAYEQTGQTRDKREEFARDEGADESHRDEANGRDAPERDNQQPAQQHDAPAMNGHTASEDDGGLRRTLRANGRKRSEAAEREEASPPADVTPDTVETPPPSAETAGEEGEAEPKPKRRSRAGTRPRRSRRTDAEAAPAETGEPAS